MRSFRLSTRQAEALIILFEGGVITWDMITGDVYLEDANRKQYSFARNTFRVLKDGGYIEVTNAPEIRIYKYGLTDICREYLLKSFQKTTPYLL